MSCPEQVVSRVWSLPRVISQCGLFSKYGGCQGFCFFSTRQHASHVTLTFLYKAPCPTRESHHSENSGHTVKYLFLFALTFFICLPVNPLGPPAARAVGSPSRHSGVIWGRGKADWKCRLWFTSPRMSSHPLTGSQGRCLSDFPFLC